MNHVKALVLNKGIYLRLAQFVGLLSIATLAPLLGTQAIAGPIVNAALFASVLLLGCREAILIGLVPSVIAISFGFLPAVLAPLVPFIIMGNAMLVLVFNKFKKVNYWLAVFLSSLFKFAFLFLTSFFALDFIAKKEVAQGAAMMMSWPQLLTALAGGVIVYFLLKNRIKQ